MVGIVGGMQFGNAKLVNLIDLYIFVISCVRGTRSEEASQNKPTTAASATSPLALEHKGLSQLQNTMDHHMHYRGFFFLIVFSTFFLAYTFFMAVLSMIYI